MHLTCQPVAGVLVSVGPLFRAVAVRLPELKVALVVSAIAICLASVAVHSIVSPFAVVKRAIRPALQALTSLQPIDKVTLVEAAITVLQLTVAALDVEIEVSRVDGVVVGDLAAEAALLALFPPALVERTVRLGK